MAQRDPRIHLLDNPKRITSSGMNLGIRAAKYDYILWVSGHVVLQLSHIRRAVETMLQTGAAAVGGVLHTEGTGAIGRLNAAVLSHPFGVGSGTHRIGGKSGWVFAVTMALYRKSALLAVGGFDETLPRNQDNDLHSRLNAQGFRSYLDNAINPTYFCRSTLGGLLRQAWNNGYWNVKLMAQARLGLRIHHFVPMLFVCVIAILGIAAALRLVPYYWLVGLLGIYLATALVVSVSISFRKRLLWQLPLLPIWFFCLHFTYGIASWAALLTGVRRPPQRTSDG